MVMLTRCIQQSVYILAEYVTNAMQVRVNWAFQKDQREDTSGHCHIFVGDLGNDVSHKVLFDAFQHCGDCSDARVMWDHATGR